MLTLQEGVIQKIDMPSGFELNEETRGGMGMNWLRVYSPKGVDGVSISLFYRGAPELVEYARVFRSLLKNPAVVFDDSDGPKDEGAQARVRSIQSCLGNAGNNQITNPEHSRFYLEKIQTIELCGRPVMAVQGYFFGPDGQVDNNYMGVFFDATPDDREACRIEEIVFEAANWDLFEQYFAEFQKTLNSVRWAKS